MAKKWLNIYLQRIVKTSFANLKRYTYVLYKLCNLYFTFVSKRDVCVQCLAQSILLSTQETDSSSQDWRTQVEFLLPWVLYVAHTVQSRDQLICFCISHKRIEYNFVRRDIFSLVRRILTELFSDALKKN